MFKASVFVGLLALVATTAHGKSTIGELLAAVDVVCPQLSSDLLTTFPTFIGEVVPAFSNVTTKIDAAAIPGLIKNFTIYTLVPSDAAWKKEGTDAVTFVQEAYKNDTALILFAAGKKNADGGLPTSLVTSGSNYELPLTVNADGTVTVQGPEGTAIATPVPEKCGNGELVVWSMDTVLLAPANATPYTPPSPTPSPTPSAPVAPSSVKGTDLAACFLATAAVLAAMPLA